jgi:hypothetical protein
MKIINFSKSMSTVILPTRVIWQNINAKLLCYLGQSVVEKEIIRVGLRATWLIGWWAGRPELLGLNKKLGAILLSRFVRRWSVFALKETIPTMTSKLYKKCIVYHKDWANCACNFQLTNLATYMGGNTGSENHSELGTWELMCRVRHRPTVGVGVWAVNGRLCKSRICNMLRLSSTFE